MQHCETGRNPYTKEESWIKNTSHNIKCNFTVCFHALKKKAIIHIRVSSFAQDPRYGSYNKHAPLSEAVHYNKCVWRSLAYPQTVLNRRTNAASRYSILFLIFTCSISISKLYYFSLYVMNVLSNSVFKNRGVE